MNIKMSQLPRFNNLSLGDALVSHDERIRRAVGKVRAMRSWNKIQQKWIDRFEN